MVIDATAERIGADFLRRIRYPTMGTQAAGLWLYMAELKVDKWLSLAEQTAPCFRSAEHEMYDLACRCVEKANEAVGIMDGIFLEQHEENRHA